MMKYMSDASGRERYWHGSAGYNAENAIREAERILAETERPSGPGSKAWAGFGERNRFGTYDPYRDYYLALADSLSAVLSVLDELAEQATKDAYLSPRVMDEDSFWSLWDSNRATLAAMDARQ